MPVARLLVERYKKRDLAAQVRSSNGLRGIFKFSEILGSPRITTLASNEIFSPSNKIHREVGRAKDLSAPMYIIKLLYNVQGC